MFLPWKLSWCQVEDSQSTLVLIFDSIVEAVVDRFAGVHVDVPIGSGRLAVGVTTKFAASMVYKEYKAQARNEPRPND
jgi:hypothetical protein